MTRTTGIRAERARTVSGLEDAALARGALDAIDAPGGDGLAMGIVFRIIRLNMWMVQDFESTIYRPNGISNAGFAILYVLQTAGSVEPRNLADAIGVSRASVSSALNTLERDGWVERRRQSDDRRVVTVVLTKTGRALMKKLSTLQHRREREWVADLTIVEQAQLSGLLDQLLQANRGRIES